MLNNRAFLKKVFLYYTFSVLFAAVFNIFNTNHAVHQSVNVLLAVVSVPALVLSFRVGLVKGPEISEYIDFLPESIIITDKNGTVEYINKSFETLTGYSKEELLGNKISRIKSGKTPDSIYKDLWETILDGRIWSGRIWNMKKDGTLFYEKIKISPLFEDGKIRKFIAVVENYTEEYTRLSRSLEASQLMKSIMDNIPIGVVLLNERKEIMQINRTVAYILKYSSYTKAISDLKGKECCSVICDSKSNCALETKNPVLCNKKVTIEINGETVSLVKTVFPVTINEEPMYIEMLLDISETIRHEAELERETERANLLAKKSREAEERIKKYNENLELMVSERTDELHQVITNLKQAQSQLVQSEKLISIGQLSAGIAHEINTPIQYVGDNLRFFEDAFIELLFIAEKYEEIPGRFGNDKFNLEGFSNEVLEVIEKSDLSYLRAEVPGAIEQSLEGVDRVAGIVRSMKEFSHPGTTHKADIDINKALQSTITVSKNEWKYFADVKTEFDESLPTVPCYPSELNQVFLNIIINAAHAISEKIGSSGRRGEISVKTLKKGRFVEIRISDTGGGIPKKVQNKIFDPFFTTKEVGKGTGQGLSISYSVVVEKHGGSILFETEEGEGTTFIISLPLEL